MAGPAFQQAQAYAPDGSAISAEETAAAVKEGRAFFQKGAKVYARNARGDLVTVAAEDATTPGYQVLSPTELREAALKRDAETATGLVKTAGEGLARGATMGFLGPEQFYDKDGREAARARQKYNPNLSAGTEVAGTLGAAVAAQALSGGAASGGIAARLGALAGRGALTPFRAASALGEAAEVAAGGLKLGQGVLGAGARMAARGAAEGALMGVGHEVSQAALEDVPLTAERLMAGAWDGASMGGILGGGFGVLGAGLGKAGRSIVGNMAESGDDLTRSTGTWAEKAQFKQVVGNNGKIYDRATSYGADMARPARIGRKLLDADMPTATGPMLRKAEALVDDAANRLKTTAAAADELGATANVEALLARVDDQISKLRETPFGDFQAIADRVERQVAPFRARVTGEVAELNKLGLTNSRYLRNGYRDQSLAETRSAYAGASKAEAQRIALGEALPRSSPKHLQGKPMEPVRVDLYPGEPPILNDGRHRMLAAQEAGADRIMARITKYDAEGNQLGESLQALSINGGSGPKFSELWDLRKKLDDTINWEAKQQGPAKEALTEMRDAFRAELDDTIARAADGGNPELLTAWKKATEDYSDFALVKQSLKELSKRQDKNRAVSASDYGTGGAAGLLMGILSGSPVTGIAVSAATSAAHKLIRERGAGVLARIADRQGNVASRMEMAGKVAAMVEAPKKLATVAAVNVGQQFTRYSELVTQAQAEPVKFAKQLGDATADLSLRFPEVASQVQQTMLADIAYLQQLHPKPASREQASLTPLAVQPQFYSYNQKQAFVDAAMALDNPMGVFDSIAKGDLPLTQINALKERRPALYGEMQRTVIKYTMTREQELPFNRRMLLGTAFDFPADWSMLHVGDIQASLAMSAETQSPNDPRAAPSKVSGDPGAQVSPGQF